MVQSIPHFFHRDIWGKIFFVRGCITIFTHVVGNNVTEQLFPLEVDLLQVLRLTGYCVYNCTTD
jgi:hypothetical protein